jgi:hypothetical protein
MAIPELYLEGLTQRALRGQEQLNTYKLGLVEAILKETLRAGEEQDVGTIRTALQTALDVARWELRPAPRSSPRSEGTGT